MAREIEEAIEQAPKIGEWGTRASQALHEAVLEGGDRTRDIADALHGTWLGRPLHPPLTDVTIGSWVLGGFFDAVAGVSGSRRAAWAGDRLTEIGVAAAIPTALSGLSDFSTVPKPATKPATVHALLNAAAVGLYTASVVERWRGRKRRGRALGWTGLAVGTVSAWFGGSLVYEHKVGTDHSETFEGPTDWQPVLSEHVLEEGQLERVDVEGAGVLLYREGERIYAIGSVCSHAAGPLEDGEVHDGCVQCPWHDSVFRLSDGAVVHGPAVRPQPAFDTRVRDGQIELRLAGVHGVGTPPVREPVAGAAT